MILAAFPNEVVSYYKIFPITLVGVENVYTLSEYINLKTANVDHLKEICTLPCHFYSP